MLSRRHLRVKAMQALYAFFQSDHFDIGKGEKELLRSIDKVYDLFFLQLLFLIEVKHAADKQIEDNKLKMLPGEEDLNPNMRFVQNPALLRIVNHDRLNFLCSSRKLSWSNEKELVRKVFFSIRDGQEYQQYMAKESTTFEEDKEFVLQIFCNYIAENEAIHFLYEEDSIFWIDDFYPVNTAIIKFIKSIEAEGPEQEIPSLYKDPEDDRQFVIDLYRKTIVNQEKYGEWIKSKVKNWEMDRIALMDIILMKMAICEILNFPSIPVKVSLNEYIELSKEYSTDKSKVFINGIIDKLILDFRTQDLIRKSGRGLME